MADTQGLFDALAGAAGTKVDRPALNNFVATAQARNGLVSAQTQDAMLKAQQASEELDASSQLESKYVAAGMKPSDAALAATISKAHYGNAVEALKATGQVRLGYGTPEDQVAGEQMATGKIAGPVTVPDNFMIPPGSPLANTPVQQSPEGLAKTQNAAAEAKLHKVQADAGGYKPSAPAAPALNDDATYNAAVTWNQYRVMPPLGMGPASTADRKRVLEFAANLSHDPSWSPPSWSQGAPAAPGPSQVPNRGGVAPGAPAPSQVPTDPNAAPAPVGNHPTLQNAQDAAANPADSKAVTASLVDMTKRTAVADSSEQTALRNLAIVRQTLQKADQTGSPLANTIINKVRAGAFGDPDVSAYHNAMSTARNEYARVISMATGAQGITDAAMREGLKLFPDDLAPAQFESNVVVASQEMANRTAAMHDQIATQRRALHGGPAPTVPTPGPAVSSSTTPISLDAYLKAQGH